MEQFNLRKIDYINISIVLILIFSRLIPHPPNFTPVIAVAVLSNYFFKNIYISLSVLFLSLFLSDLLIGLYTNMLLVYFAIFVVAVIFFKNFKLVNYKNLFFASLIGSLVFFLISNFGVWLLGSLYEKNLEGLVECYILAIPFFKNTFLSTIFYTYLTFFCLDFLKKKIELSN
tara:strand:- start:3411 stop:3929 length:519 start_codon:yes stop_codon:yes gene_type:complete